MFDYTELDLLMLTCSCCCWYLFVQEKETTHGILWHLNLLTSAEGNSRNSSDKNLPLSSLKHRNSAC